MGKINLTPLSMRGQDLDNAQAIRRIESYLYQLNEELRYELTHIDEDNMAANNTTVYTAPSSSEESAGAQTVNGQTIDLNDNALIIQLKARIAELQKGQQTALNGVNNNTQAITDANREISSMKNKLDNLSWSYNRHKHSIEIDASGNLSMGGPTANPTYPNIADTAYVQGLVSAARTAGYNEGRRDWRPDNITISGKNVTVINAAGDDVGGPYSAAAIYNDGYSAGVTNERNKYTSMGSHQWGYMAGGTFIGIYSGVLYSKS